MKTIIFAVIVSLFFATALSAQVVLNGSLHEDTEPLKAVPNTRIGVAGGPGDTTDSKGQFSIKLSREFIQGEKGYSLPSCAQTGGSTTPWMGSGTFPNIKTEDVQTKKVKIVPKGSMKLWSHERIATYVAKLSDQVAKARGR